MSIKDEDIKISSATFPEFQPYAIHPQSISAEKPHAKGDEAFMESPEIIHNALSQATGTGHYWRAFPDNDNFLFTDGIKNMAEMCDAFWLVTAIFSWQGEGKVKGEPFQVWRLCFQDRTKGGEAFLVCEDGNNKELARQEIEYTDFPLPKGITLYLDGGVLLLPSEY
jgi:hypothetical protein